jgi:hypothetical protein
MSNLIDDVTTESNNLDDKINEYWPSFKDGKIGRSEIRKELKPKFKDEQIQCIIDELSDRHLNGYKGNDIIKNIENSSRKTGAYLYLILGVVLVFAGVCLTWVFWQAGWIAFLTLFMVSAGVGIIFQANKRINRLNQVK